MKISRFRNCRENKMEDPIDFVITWVDGNDPEWRKERDQYAALVHGEKDNSIIRYRDWDLLKYWFRGVEKFAPWVNNIFFVTWGHLPEWLNVNHPKLKIVKHSDFIPAEYLPTFSSNVFEYYFHRIEGLSDRFVYFNDDMFLIDKVSPSRFFKKGFPCDKAVMTSLERHDGMYGSSVYLANFLVNVNIDKRTAIRDNFYKWYNSFFIKTTIKNLFFYRNKRFPGFYSHHLPQGYLKQTYRNVWTHCEKDLKRTSSNKFRSYGDIAPWLLRFWQLASGNFTLYDVDKDGQCLYMDDKSIPQITDFIIHQRKKMICLNDSESIRYFDEDKKMLLEAFNTILSEKCGFEL